MSIVVSTQDSRRVLTTDPGSDDGVGTYPMRIGRTGVTMRRLACVLNRAFERPIEDLRSWAESDGPGHPQQLDVVVAVISAVPITATTRAELFSHEVAFGATFCQTDVRGSRSPPGPRRIALDSDSAVRSRTAAGAPTRGLRRGRSLRPPLESRTDRRLVTERGGAGDTTH